MRYLRGGPRDWQSYLHPSCRLVWALPPRAIAREIEQAQATLTALAGYAPRWFRAVVGHANPFVTPVLKQLGLIRVSWSVRGFDAVDGDVDRVLTRIKEHLKPGAIVVLHEGAVHHASIEIMERTLQELIARGLKATLPPYSIGQ